MLAVWSRDEAAGHRLPLLIHAPVFAVPDVGFPEHALQQAIAGRAWGRITSVVAFDGVDNHADTGDGRADTPRTRSNSGVGTR